MNPSDTIFRKPKKSDLNTIQTIANNTVDQGYRYFLGDQTVDSYLNSNSLESYLTKNFEDMWVLLHDNKIVGFAICIENIIDFMLIKFDCQRKGLGVKLLKNCEQLLFENYNVIALESFEENSRATEFYLSNDWQLTDKYKDSKSNTIKLIFRKQLNTA